MSVSTDISLELEEREKALAGEGLTSETVRRCCGGARGGREGLKWVGGEEEVALLVGSGKKLARVA